MLSASGHNPLILTIYSLVQADEIEQALYAANKTENYQSCVENVWMAGQCVEGNCTNRNADRKVKHLSESNNEAVWCTKHLEWGTFKSVQTLNSNRLLSKTNKSISKKMVKGQG